MNHDPSHQDPEPVSFWRTRYAVGLIVMSAVAAYFLLGEHRAHFFGALPFLLLLACPLMHVFMHHGHGGHDSDNAYPHDSEEGPTLAVTPPSTAGERP